MPSNPKCGSGVGSFLVARDVLCVPGTRKENSPPEQAATQRVLQYWSTLSVPLSRHGGGCRITGMHARCTAGFPVSVSALSLALCTERMMRLQVAVQASRKVCGVTFAFPVGSFLPLMKNAAARRNQATWVYHSVVVKCGEIHGVPLYRECFLSSNGTR